MGGGGRGGGGTWIAIIILIKVPHFGRGGRGGTYHNEGCWLYLFLEGGRGRGRERGRERGHLDCYYHIKVPHFGRGRERGQDAGCTSGYTHLKIQTNSVVGILHTDTDIYTPVVLSCSIAASSL